MEGTVTISIRDYERWKNIVAVATTKKGVIRYNYPENVYFASSQNEIAADANNQVEIYKQKAENAENELNKIRRQLEQAKDAAAKYLIEL